jgi:hypothetical protein
VSSRLPAAGMLAIIFLREIMFLRKITVSL